MIEAIPYYLSAILFIFGLYFIISSMSFFHKLIGLSILQIGVLVFYISLGKIFNALPPIHIKAENILYANPLPHVLMLTAIVVGFATLSVGLALLLKIQHNFGTLSEGDLDSE